MEEVHAFTAGVDRDTSPHLVKNDKATALRNFRLVTIDGQGYVLNNLRGNQFQFQLTDGFVPLGYATYNGVAFIFSLQPATGMCEVGTYPSPKQPCTVSGYEHVYRPLQNWNGNMDPRVLISRLDLRTKLFNFDCTHQLEVEARISYDNSVELFFTDYFNPLRHINTGFDIDTGICNQRLLWEGSFPNLVNVLFETCKHPIPTSINIGTDGAIQAGNWFLYARYSTLDLNKTSFLSEIGPFQITRDDLNTGWQLDGNAALVDTGRSITVDLTNIDSNFPYLEIAFVYYHDTTFDVKLIGTPYQIPAGATTLTVKITGLEPIVDLTIAELINRKTTADTPRSIAQLENRLWGANWKERDMPYTAMKDLAASLPVVPVNPSQLFEIQDTLVYEAGSTNLPFQYKNYRNTYGVTGYFRGETYPFAMVFVFTDGKESRPYPCRGQDAWYGGGVNTKGILRFPSNMQPNYAYFNDFGNGFRPQVMGVVFDTTGIVLPQEITDQVCGFYFVRGERQPNLIYQGLIANCYSGQQVSYNLPGFGYINAFYCGAPTEEKASTWIPEMSFRSSTPGLFALPVEMHAEGETPDIALDLVTTIAPTANKFGLFSTDHFFKQDLADGNYTVIRQGQAGDTGLPRLYERHMSPSNSYAPDFYFDQQRFTPDSGAPLKGVYKCYNIAPRNVNAIAGFTSGYYFGDDSTLGLPQFYYAHQICAGTPDVQREAGNRPMYQRNYVGMSYGDPGTTSISIGDDPISTPLGPAIVNVYKTDPDPANGYDITILYDPATTIYFRIGPFIPIADWSTLASRPFFHGDCFIQRTYHRHLNPAGGHANADNVGGLYYVYGNLVGCVQECAINTAMRFEGGATDADQRYYPEKFPLDPMQFAGQWTASDESRLLNGGYDHVLGLQGALGDDPLVPFRGVKYPTRIKFSHTYINDQFTDGYLKWDFDGYKDYDHRMGQIMTIRALDTKLCSVQEQGINFHYINDRAALSPTASEGELLVGTGAILSEKFLNISDQYGTQHQWSITRSEQGLYGYDQNKRKFWKLTTSKGLDRISDRLSFRKDAILLSEIFSDHSDIIHGYADAAICHDGVVGFWDRKHGDVGWSFIIYDRSSLVLTQQFHTIVYNEMQDVYMHERTHHSPFYMRINEDLYSIDPAFTPTQSNQPVGKFYLHDKDNFTRCNFYGVQNDCMLSFASNMGMKGPKVYDSIQLGCSEVPPNFMVYNTEFQLSTLNPFLDPLPWKSPVYKENCWRTPYLMATVITAQTNQDYQVGSRMRGKYLVTEYDWLTDLAVEVAAATVKFRPSFN